MQQLQQHRCNVRPSSRVASSVPLRQQRPAGSRLHIAAAASVEQQIDTGVGSTHLIAPDATQLIGNTPMVRAATAPAP